MIELIAVSLVAGVVAGISPCILPVLPVVLAAGATSTQRDDGSSAASRRRPVLIVCGLILSFSVVVLAGSELLSALHLPQDFLRDAGIVLLVVIGLSLFIPALANLMERPFARLERHQPNGAGEGFVVGLALGLVFVPCAGPILAAITVVGATHRVGLTAIVVTVAFGIGAAIPLLAVALAGRELAGRVRALRSHAPLLRRIAGGVLIAMAVAIGFNAFNSLETSVPGYTSALQDHLEGSAAIRRDIESLTGDSQHSALASCKPELTVLANCGRAPEFAGITSWLNTPGGRPLTLSELRGKVVLVDFWTYSCINCERTLPHVEAWYRRYSPDGFVVVGVHTPEFAFEHVVSNVRAEAADLGVHYPVAIDDDYATWRAYDNEYWPAEYLISSGGEIVHESFGEGGYSTTEALIRKLLVAAHPGLRLPPPTSVPNRTPTSELSPETYVGYGEESYLDSPDGIVHNAEATYAFPSSLALGQFALAGRWTENSEEATSDGTSKLELGFLAHDVYLVLGGKGTIEVAVNGRHTMDVHVGGTPRLYTLFSSSGLTTARLALRFSPGVEAYDFTFG